MDVRGRTSPPLPATGTMITAMALPGNSHTFLTHMLAHSLEDDRYVVERFQTMADGDTRRVPGDEPAKKGRRKARHTIATLKAVKEMRPARTEIIIRTGLRIKGAGFQYWVDESVLRPQAEGLSGPLRTSRRPGVLRLDSNPGREDTTMADQGNEIRRARDLERYHRRTAERRARVYARIAGSARPRPMPACARPLCRSSPCRRAWRHLPLEPPI